MNRKMRIGSALALAGVLLLAAPVGSALAISPLLSGYGGPGAGEQAIVGSTLLGGPNGGAGSGGSGGSQNSAGTGENAARGSSGAAATNGSSAAGSSGGGGLHGKAGRSSSSGGASAATGGHSTGPQIGRAATHVYPNVPASAAGESSTLGISSGDLLALLAILTTLALVGVLTMRLARLQP
jgi:hypothetical protein